MMGIILVVLVVLFVIWVDNGEQYFAINAYVVWRVIFFGCYYGDGVTCVCTTNMSYRCYGCIYYFVLLFGS